MNSVVIDEDKVDDACPVCLSEPSNPIKLSKCGHVLCYLCLKEYKNGNTFAVCPICRSEINDNIFKVTFGEHCKEIEDLVGTTCWLYQSKDHKGYWIFETNTGEAIEKLFSEKRNDINKFYIGNREYSVDFDTMTQCEVLTNRNRKIKRLVSFDVSYIKDYNIRGVAGIYFKLR